MIKYVKQIVILYDITFFKELSNKYLNNLIENNSNKSMLGGAE